MNPRTIISQLALLSLVLAGVILTFGLVGELISSDHDARTAAHALIFVGATTGLLGGIGWLATRRHRAAVDRREALLLVALTWIVGGVVCGAPYYVWAHRTAIDSAPAAAFRSWMNCHFEAISGLTTTGATTIVDIPALPNALLLWRATTHWLGGLGIVVLFVAVLPSLGVGGRRLFQAEVSGPDKGGLHPRIRETARALWIIYSAITLAQIVLLRAFGMSTFDSVCHAFATMATGGFSTKDASLAAWPNLGVQITTIIFMVLGGMNFSLFYRAWRGRLREIFDDVEFRFYIAILAMGSLLVAMSIYQTTIHTTDGGAVVASAGVAAREAAFQAVSIQTTTGFCTSNFNLYPVGAKIVLVGLMFIGGCAGSTGGGLKVIRIWMAVRIMGHELERVFRPSVVRPLRVGGSIVSQELKVLTLAFIIGMLTFFTAGFIAIMLIEGDNITFETAATASVASLCTIGPGLGLVGAVENYAWLSGWSKGVLMLLMVVGRLEVFAIAVLFTKRFWKPN